MPSVKDITKLKTTGAVRSLPHTPALRAQGPIQPVSNLTMTAEQLLAHNTQKGHVTVGNGNMMEYGEKERGQTSTWPPVRSNDSDCRGMNRTDGIAALTSEATCIDATVSDTNIKLV